MEKQIKTDVVVVGGGISGLSVGHFLNRAGLQVRVVEKEAYPGGNIRTAYLNGFRMELGPTSILLTSPLITQLISDVGLENEVIFSNPQAERRFILKEGKLQPMPFSPPAFFCTPLFSWRTKLRLMMEPFIAPHDPNSEPTLAEFVRRRLGSEILEYAVDPFVAGIFAGSPERLSVRAAFPRLWELEQRYGSFIRGTLAGRRERKKRSSVSKNAAKMFSFRKGLQELIQALYAMYQDSVITQAEITSVQKEGNWFVTRMETPEGPLQVISRAVVSAIPAYAYGEQFPFLPREILSILHAIEYAPIAVVFVGYNKWDPRAHPLDGFGFLVPRSEKRRILGVLWNSSIFPERAPDGGAALTVYIGGSRQPELVDLPESALTHIALEELKALLHVQAAPDEVFVKKYEKAIPQYTIGHPDRVARLRQFQETVPGFYFAGNFLEGVSVSDCIKNGAAVADDVLRYLEAQWDFIRPAQGAVHQAPLQSQKADDLKPYLN